MRVYQKHAGDDAKLLIKFHWPNHDCATLKYDDENSSKKVVLLNNRLWKPSRLQINVSG